MCSRQDAIQIHVYLYLYLTVVYVCVTDICPAHVRFHGVDYAGVRCAVNIRWSQRNSLHHCTVDISFSTLHVARRGAERMRMPGRIAQLAYLRSCRKTHFASKNALNTPFLDRRTQFFFWGGV